jgi:hypothetical protein
MHVKIAAIVAGVAAALITSGAFAQPAPQGGPYDQGPPPGQMPGQTPPGQMAPYAHPHTHGVVGIIRGEMSAGRLSQKEGALIIEKIKQMHVERREERESGYGPQGAPPGQPPMQPPPGQPQ